MKTGDINIRTVLWLCGLLLFMSGCYTVLMTPGSTGRDDYASGGVVSESDEPSELNYSDNCLSCHSQTELDDRSYDMQKVGMVSVHGITLDQSGWQSPSSASPWWGAPVPPAPPAAASISAPTSSPNKPEKKRPTGDSRGSEATPASDPGTQASSPAPAASSVPAAPTPPPAAAVGRDRSSTGGDQNSGDRTRTSGSTTTTTSTSTTSTPRKPD